MARQARLGRAWPGEARQGKAGEARRGMAGPGKARQGRRGRARLGWAWLGKARQARQARRGLARHGQARQGKAGKARKRCSKGAKKMRRIKACLSWLMLFCGVVSDEMADCGVDTGYAGERKDDMEGTLCQVLLDDVVIRADWNARKRLPEEDIRGLRASMDDVGQLNVISVRRRSDDKFDLIAGEKRLLAARMAKKRMIDARIYDDLSIEQELRIMLDENLVRKDLNVIEEAEAFSRLAEFRTVDEIASLYSRSSVYVRERLDLLTLPREVKWMMVRPNNPLRIHQALLLVGLGKEADQLRIAREAAPKAATANVSEAEVRDLVREAKGEKKLPMESPARKPRESTRIKDEIDEPRQSYPPRPVGGEATAITPADQEPESVDCPLAESAEESDDPWLPGDITIQGRIVFDNGLAYIENAHVAVCIDPHPVWHECDPPRMLLDLPACEVARIDEMLMVGGTFAK